MNASPPRLEVQVERLLRDQQVRVHRGEVAELGVVVRRHRVAALEPLGAEQVREAVREHVEVDGARVVVEEPGVVERGRVPRLEPVLVVAEDPGEDQVGEDRLLLLPPRLAVVPGEAVPLLRRRSCRAPSRRTSRRAAGRCRSAASARRSSRAVSTYFSLGRTLLMRIRFQAIFRLWPTTARLCCHLYA